MKSLPFILDELLRWWLYKAPRKIFVTLKRFARIVNNEVSFTLNLKLMFTPLFGDYTKTGRLIGFIFRTFFVTFGGIFMIGILFLTAILPLLWWGFPVVLVYYLKMFSIPVVLAISLIHVLYLKNVPLKRVSQTDKGNIFLSFRPESYYLIYSFYGNAAQAFENAFRNSKITNLLKRAELQNESFLSELKSSKLVTKSIDRYSYDLATKEKSRYVEAEQVFTAVLANIHDIDTLLSKHGSSLKLLEETASWIVREREDMAKIFFWQEDYDMEVLGGVGKGLIGHVTPALDSVSEDFTSKAKQGWVKETIGHSKEIDEIADILGGTKENVLITGAPGCGKTSVVKAIAFKIIRGTPYEVLKNKRIVSMDPGSLIAGARTPGDLAEKLKRIMEEVESSGDIILFIDNIHNLVTGMVGEDVAVSSVYTILEPYLSSGKFKVLAATNLQNYRKYIEPNGSFARLFHPVEIEPTTRDESVEILKYVSKDFEKNYGVSVTLPALRKIVELSDKFIHERVLPDKAIDILNRCVVSVTKDKRCVDSAVVAAQVSKVSHVPLEAVTIDESEKLLNIESEMKKYVIGQSHAIDQIGKALKRARMGIRNEDKPIASFLFVGTTGVGKTETAKTLAKIYFEDEDAFIRVDMSEYQQLDSINRLLGSPDGSVQGILSEAVRTRPFSIVLLDEVEKAYPSILMTFLQVLDDGRLTDTSGRVIDFTSTIIIATSNVGTRKIQEIAQKGGKPQESAKAALEEVRNHFAPEFLNRFNGIIVFNPLTLEDVKQIASLMLEKVRKMAENKDIKVNFKPELIDEIIKRGFSEEWGARPLARTIEDNVETHLAVKMLAQEFKKGDTVELGAEVFQTT